MNLQDIDHLLTTTRSVRKRLDLEKAVEPQVIQECLDIALQAPTGSNKQQWHFVVVTDAEKRAKIADYYKRSFMAYAQQSSSVPSPQRVDRDQTKRVISSAMYLAENMQHVPVLIIPCYEGRVETAPQATQAGFYGSILPATWSLMLALRSRGLGSSWTTLHLVYEKEVAELLNIPENVTQVALLPVAYYTGDDFKPAKRLPASQITYWDSWESTNQ